MKVPTLGVLLACAAFALPAAAPAQTRFMVDGRDWQRSTVEQRRAYLTGVQNTLVAAARYDAQKGGRDTYALRAQRGMEGTRVERAVLAVDAFYKAHPNQMNLPVLTVIWREVAKQPDAPK